MDEDIVEHLKKKDKERIKKIKEQNLRKKNIQEERQESGSCVHHREPNQDLLPINVPLESELTTEVKRYLKEQEFTLQLYTKKRSFSGIEKTLDNIISNQKKFDLIIRARKSPMVRLYVGTKNKLSKLIFGKNSPSLDDLFESQIRNGNELNGNLYGVIDSAKTSLEGIEHIVDIRTIRNRADFTEGKNLEITLNDLRLDVQKEEKISKNLNINDERYLGQELKVRNLKRDLDRLTTKYILLGELQEGGEGQKVYFESLEKVLRTTIQTSERVLNKSVLFYDTLNHAKEIYRSIGDLLNAVDAIEEPVNMLRNDVKEIEVILFDGVKRMKEQILGEADYKSIQKSNLPIKGLLEDLRRTKYYRQS